MTITVPVTTGVLLPNGVVGDAPVPPVGGTAAPVAPTAAPAAPVAPAVPGAVAPTPGTAPVASPAAPAAAPTVAAALPTTATLPSAAAAPAVPADINTQLNQILTTLGGITQAVSSAAATGVIPGATPGAIPGQPVLADADPIAAAAVGGGGGGGCGGGGGASAAVGVPGIPAGYVPAAVQPAALTDLDPAAAAIDPMAAVAGGGAIGEPSEQEMANILKAAAQTELDDRKVSTEGGGDVEEVEETDESDESDEAEGGGDKESKSAGKGEGGLMDGLGGLMEMAQPLIKMAIPMIGELLGGAMGGLGDMGGGSSAPSSDADSSGVEMMSDGGSETESTDKPDEVPVTTVQDPIEGEPGDA